MNKIQILVVEDDAPVRNLITTTLKAHDYRFATAVNGSSELAYRSGIDVKMIPGEERNFKITTPEDLILFKRYLESGEYL